MRPTKSNDDEDLEVYNSVVFQDARVMSGPNDMGFLEISTINTTMVVIKSRQCRETDRGALGLRQRTSTPFRERSKLRPRWAGVLTLPAG